MTYNYSNKKSKSSLKNNNKTKRRVGHFLISSISKRIGFLFRLIWRRIEMLLIKMVKVNSLRQNLQ